MQKSAARQHKSGGNKAEKTGESRGSQERGGIARPGEPDQTFRLTCGICLNPEAPCELENQKSDEVG